MNIHAEIADYQLKLVASRQQLRDLIRDIERTEPSGEQHLGALDEAPVHLTSATATTTWGFR